MQKTRVQKSHATVPLRTYGQPKDSLDGASPSRWDRSREFRQISGAVFCHPVSRQPPRRTCRISGATPLSSHGNVGTGTLYVLQPEVDSCQFLVSEPCTNLVKL